jgi:uncharacterized protein YjeT (DUF2065 family)
LDVLALAFGIVFIVIGLSITVKTRTVKWGEAIRAIIDSTSEQDAYFKWLGLALIAVGIIMILSAFKTV